MVSVPQVEKLRTLLEYDLIKLFEKEPEFLYIPSFVVEKWKQLGPFRLDYALDTWKIEVNEKMKTISSDGMKRYIGQTSRCKNCILSDKQSSGVGRKMGTWGIYEGY